MLKTFICPLIAVICVLALLLPVSVMAQERGGIDPYAVITNYHYDEKLGEGYVWAREGMDPDPGRGDDFTPQYNDYDWSITDPVGIRQSELDQFRANCASYAQGFGVDGIVVHKWLHELEEGLNSVQLVPNMIMEKDDVLLKGSFSIFFPPNYSPDLIIKYPIVVQIPGFDRSSLNDLVFRADNNGLPLGFLTSIKSYFYDPANRGVVFVIWNAGGYLSLGANSESRNAIGHLFRVLRTRCRCDRERVIAMGSSRGAFGALTLAENTIHGEKNYNVLGVFASSPPLSMGTMTTIPIATNPDLANLYRIYGGPDAYQYSHATPPGTSPQPGLMPVFGTSDPLQADFLCPDYDGSSGGTDNLARLQGKYVYLSAGTHDSFFPVTHFITMDNNLSARGIDHTTFLVVQGGHGPSPKDQQLEIFSDFVFQVMTDEAFDPAQYVPPAPYKHGTYEAARNYLLDTDLENHQSTDAQGESTMKTLFLKELPFSATMPRRLGSNVYGTGTPNVADEPGIVHLTGAAGKRWEVVLHNPSSLDTFYRTGFFGSSETAEVSWWGDEFPVSAAGNCGPDGGCTPENDWLRWSALYNLEQATGNTNYTIDGNRLALETEIIDRQPLPQELRVKYLDPIPPSVALGVDLFPRVVTEIRCSQTSGTAPFTPNFSMTMANNSEDYRKLAFRLDTLLASGYFIASHRTGYTNVAPYGRFETSVNMTLPALQSLNGDNLFTLFTEDVTPAPYNQPPFPPSGARDTHSVTVHVVVP